MAFTVPTYSDFMTRYPVFAPISEPLVQAVLDEAAGTVGAPDRTRWLEGDYAPAIMLLTAHTLIVDGALSGGATSSVGQYAGPITKERVGEVEVTYGAQGSGSGGAASGDGLASTVYGQRYLALMRANFSGPMVA
ncbi:DUF4054 domain-containing protein [Aureimonas ureilytica]|uniref:DUF4054 domain-containing protein n=1 Tax=Aureimonas ureilytica TaxID=401562 RepID=UPI0003658705|nr:DUF4054 domain-containing protein [Aureimonas ureilytica]